MDPWTPADREGFIAKALECDDQKGQCGPYHFKVYPKVGGIDCDDPKKAAMTDALARTIFAKNPKYKMITMKFYELLVNKIRTSTFVNLHFMNNFYILMKGGNAYRMILGEQFAEDFPYSDLDLVIFINPYIGDELFNALRTSLNSILLQVLSQYKRILDHMLFLNKPSPEWFLDDATIQQFKADLKAEFEQITGFDGAFLTPFVNDEVRNSCSKHSFVLRDSVAHENSVVRIEVPHYDRCERIPLRKTPLMASHNSSISFSRGANAALKGEFDLYRLKFTGMYVGVDEGRNDMFENKISVDFIDVSIAHKEDAELIDFWHHGRCVNVYDHDLNLWVVVPDIYTCVRDLYKMLHVYDCPEHKREKRMKRYQIMQGLCMPHA